MALTWCYGRVKAIGGVMRSIIGEFKNARAMLKKEGFKALFRKYGWKLPVAVVAYYLVRDLTLYVLIPVWFLK